MPNPFRADASEAEDLPANLQPGGSRGHDADGAGPVVKTIAERRRAGAERQRRWRRRHTDEVTTLRARDEVMRQKDQALQASAVQVETLRRVISTRRWPARDARTKTDAAAHLRVLFNYIEDALDETVAELRHAATLRHTDGNPMNVIDLGVFTTTRKASTR
jgi:hypothetical protein